MAIFDWRSKFWAKGYVNSNGSHIPADQIVSHNRGYDKRLWAPCVGVILNVHMGDSPNNASRLYRGLYSHTFDAKKTIFDSKEYLTAVEERSNTYGPHVQASVRILKGMGTDQPFINYVPICLGFGGIDNYGMVVPHGVTVTADMSRLYKSDGDFCVVQFAGGDYTEPMITNIYPHPCNIKDTPLMEDGNVAFFRVNGFEFKIDKDGSAHINGKNAGNKRTIDPDTGNLTTLIKNRVVADPEKNSPPGFLVIENNSNIIVSAGDDEEQGNLILMGKTTSSLASVAEQVIINTAIAEKRVDLQNIHGGLRPAARIHDGVEITSGGEGDLFTYLSKLKDCLKSTGEILSTAGGSSAAAGAMLVAFAGGVALPTKASGTITEGSDYVYIGGEFSSGDISETGGSGDTSGYKDEDGNPKDPEELVVTCLPLAAASYLSEYAVNVQQKATQLIMQTLGPVTDAVEKLPPPYNKAAEPLKQSMPIIAKSIMGGGTIPPEVDAAMSELEVAEAAVTAAEAAVPEPTPEALADLQQAVATAAEKVANLVGAQMSASVPIDKDIQLAIDLGTAAAAQDLPKLDALTGGAMSDAINVCIDDKLA